MTTRDVIGQAKGILMERQHQPAGAAFDVLREASQRLNRKVSDIAEHLAATGELPT
jgi:AmiR/NasT family two-component response regulator